MFGLFSFVFIDQLVVHYLRIKKALIKCMLIYYSLEMDFDGDTSFLKYDVPRYNWRVNTHIKTFLKIKTHIWATVAKFVQV